MNNIFKHIPDRLSEELIETILKTGTFKIERIVSKGQATPDGQWYDQDKDEWVLLLSGRAGLRIEGRTEVIMAPGDFLHLPAHLKHRVEWTDPEKETVWLAIHYPPET